MTLTLYHTCDSLPRFLQDLGYAGVSDGLYVGILIIMIVVYRLALWGVLVMKKR